MSIAPKRIGGLGEYEANLGDFPILSHTFPYFPYKNGSQFVTWSFSILFGSFLCVLLFFHRNGLFIDHFASNRGRRFRLKQISQPLLEMHLNQANQANQGGPIWPVRHDIDLTVVDQVANAIHLTNLRRTLRSLRIQCSPLST